MVQITVSEDFARQIAGVPLPIVLVDSQGRQLGQVTQLNSSPTCVESPNISADDEWSAAKRQMEIHRRVGGNFYTTQEVLAHLESLEKE